MKVQSREPSSTYIEILNFCRLAQFPAAGELLKNSDQNLQPWEKAELQSLIRFQTGQISSTPYPQFWERFLCFCLIKSGVCRFILQAFLVGISKSASLFGLEENLERRALVVGLPACLEYVYTNFTSGLAQTFLCYHLLSNKNYYLEKLRIGSFMAHFFCLQGRFDIGNPKLKEIIVEITKFKNEKAQSFYWYYDREISARAMYALELSWIGQQSASMQEFKDIQKQLEVHPYFFISVFSHAMRSFPSLELLDQKSNIEDARALQKILGNTFLSKYALRTSIQSALICAIDGDFQAASQHLVTSSEYYQKTAVTVELLAYHYMRARVDLELGETSSAIQNINRALSFTAPTPGCVFHEADIRLSHAEIVLRSHLQNPQPQTIKSHIKAIVKDLEWVSSVIRGSELVTMRILVVQALIKHIELDFQGAQEICNEVRARLPLISKRVSVVINQIDTESGQHFDGWRKNQIQSKIDFDFSDFLIQLSQSPNLEETAADVVSWIVAGNLESFSILEMSDSKNVRSAGEYSYYVEANKGVFHLPLAEGELFQVLISDPTRDPAFNRNCQSQLKLASRILRSERQNRSQIKLLETTNEAMRSNTETLIQSRTQMNMEHLVSQIVHDLRSPLAAIKVGLATLKQPEKQKQAIELASMGSRRIEEIIEHNLSRRKTVRDFERLELIPLLRNSIHQWKSLYPTLSIELDSEFLYEPVIFAHASELDRVLSNLVKNAYEAQGKAAQSTLTIKLALVESSFVELIFIDGGSGIDPSITSKILVGDYTSKADGNGLGISSSVRIVNKFFGDFSFVSVNQSLGVYPVIRMPLFLSEQSSKPAEEVILYENSKVYVFDDDPSIIKSIQFELKGRPVTVVPVIVDRAWNLGDMPTLEQGDTVLVDYNFNLPNITGIDIIKMAIEKYRLETSRIYLCSGFWENSSLRLFSKSTGVKFIKKPIQCVWKIESNVRTGETYVDGNTYPLQ